MSPRSYNLGSRAESVEATRRRIVLAARALFAEGGFHASPVDEVARRADVARATVYYHFGSKRGLLRAVLDDLEQRAGLERILRAMELPDVVAALRATFEVGSRYWAAEHMLASRLVGLAASDPETDEELRARDRGRAELVGRLAERLSAEGRLRARCSVERAVDILWLLGSFQVFDQLFTGRGLSANAVSDVLADLAERALVEPDHG